MSVLTNIEVQKLMCVHMFLCVCSSQEPVNKLQATHLTAAHIMKVCVCVSMCVCVLCVCVHQSFCGFDSPLFTLISLFLVLLTTETSFSFFPNGSFPPCLFCSELD